MTDPRAGHVLDLDRSTTGPAAARAFAAGYLDGVDPDVRADVLLLVSELVTNVVRHGELPAHLTLELGRDHVHVSVFDSGPGTPLAGKGASGAGTGRGLLIVAAVARSWGVTSAPSRPGKGVWFELPTSAAPH